MGDDGQCEEGLCDRTLWWSSGSEGSKASVESATTSKCYWQNILKLGKGMLRPPIQQQHKREH